MNTRQIDVPLPDFCDKKCQKFRIREEILYSFNEPYSRNYSCENEAVCRMLAKNLQKMNLDELANYTEEGQGNEKDQLYV